MIILQSPGIVERKNALNKMVNTDNPEDFRESNQKDTFQYQVPRVRASFSIKVTPDSMTANLPESAANRSNGSTITLAPKPNYPEYEPQILTTDQPVKPQVQHPVANALKIKPVLANKSTYSSINDDKDFEIPLEESLKAVEDFIRREKELSKWKVGEDVLAMWKGNGLYYKAKISEINSSGMVVVVFDCYDVTEEVNHMDLCKFHKKTDNFVKKGQKKQVNGAGKVCTSVNPKFISRPKFSYKRQNFISVFKKSRMSRRKLRLNRHKIIQKIAKTKQAQVVFKKS